MKKKDLELGMGRKITRRDLIHSTGLASLGLAMPIGAAAALEGTSTLAAENIQHAKVNCEIGSSLEKAFDNPPESARPSGYWWWLNANVDKEAITRDLENFRAKGMGSVLLVCTGNWEGANEVQGPEFLSDEWMELGVIQVCTERGSSLKYKGGCKYRSRMEHGRAVDYKGKVQQMVSSVADNDQGTAEVFW